jgi:hypothetical protein
MYLHVKKLMFTVRVDDEGASMRRNDQYEVLLRRSSECETLSKVAGDLSIRLKCAELAIEYRTLAERMKQADQHREMAELTPSLAGASHEN